MFPFGAMIAYLGEIMFEKNIFEENINKLDIKPRQRTDEVDVSDFARLNPESKFEKSERGRELRWK